MTIGHQGPTEATPRGETLEEPRLTREETSAARVNPILRALNAARGARERLMQRLTRRVLESDRPMVELTGQSELADVRPIFIGDTQLDLDAIYNTTDKQVRMELPPLKGEKIPTPVKVVANDLQVRIEPEQGPFHFFADVTPENNERQLFLNIITRDRKRKRRKGFPNGGALVDAAVSFFDSPDRGGPLTEFRTDWSRDDDKDDNFRQYEAALKKGLKKGLTQEQAQEQAAFATWSGNRVAQRHGFTHFKRIEGNSKDGYQAFFGR